METTSQGLVEKAIRGEPRAIDELVRLCEPYARKKLRQAGLRNAADEDDLVQEALLRVIKGISGFSQRREGGFRAWVSTICGNVFRTFLGRPARREIAINSLAEALKDLSVETSGRDGRIDAGAIVRILWEWQRERMSDAHRRAYEMIEFSTMTAKEVAEQTGLSEENVLMIRHRARKTMRENAERILGFSPHVE